MRFLKCKFCDNWTAIMTTNYVGVDISKAKFDAAHLGAERGKAQ
ncbi:MAG: hypothetical protein ACOYMG_11095 [Candidatus Methylumidiphilus sp.]